MRARSEAEIRARVATALALGLLDQEQAEAALAVALGDYRHLQAAVSRVLDRCIGKQATSGAQATTALAG